MNTNLLKITIGLLLLCAPFVTFAQCVVPYSQANYNTQLSNEKTLGQSFVATCTGNVSFITVQSNRNSTQFNNVQLKLWKGNAVTGQTVIYVQNNITLKGKAVPTQIEITGENEILAGNNYFFTLTHSSLDLELHAQSGGLFAGGNAVKENLQPTNELMTDDLYFVIEAILSLPVELTNFSAKVASNRNAVQLDWSTASETDNRGFAIQKSRTGRDWETIGFVEGQGTSTVAQNYQYSDHATASGICYYRLKQMDYSGDYEFSTVEVVEIENDRPLEVYPNPARDVINFVAPANNGEDFIQVYDAYGRQVTERIQLNEGTNEIDVKNLAEGIYFLQSSKGEVRRFMKMN